MKKKVVAKQCTQSKGCPESEKGLLSMQPDTSICVITDNHKNTEADIYHIISYIYIAHLEPNCSASFQMSLHNYFSARPLGTLHTVSFLIEGEPPLPDQLPGGTFIP